MKMRITKEELKHFYELRSGGIPVDDGLLKEWSQARRGLSLVQTGTPADNRICYKPSAESCFLISLAITNDSTAPITLQACRLQLPWYNDNFRWLPYPHGPFSPSFAYTHPTLGPYPFAPRLVLNHRIGRKSKLLPGDCIEGWLIGVSESGIPDEHLNHQGTQVRLSVWDTDDECYPLNVKLQIDCPVRVHAESESRAGRSDFPRRRGRLFSVKDEFEMKETSFGWVRVRKERKKELVCV